MKFKDISAFETHLRKNDSNTDKYRVQEKELSNVDEVIDFINECINSDNYEIEVLHFYDDETWENICTVGFKIILE